MKKKRHHTVPEFYLKGFADDGCIWQYPRDNSPPTQVSPRTAAVGKHFYSYRTNAGTRNTKLEDALCDVETRAAPVVRVLINGDDITDEQRLNLARLIGVQLVRGFDVRDRAAAAAHKLRDADSAIRFLESCSEIPAETRAEYRQQIVEAGEGPSIDPSYYLPHVMLRTDRYGRLISEMKWHLERAPDGCFFVTSDTPVVVRRRGHDLDEYPVGLAREDLNIEMTFPLSKHVMLLAAWQQSSRKKRKSKVTAPRVQELNRRTVLGAHRFVFAPRTCNRVAHLIETHADFRIKHAFDL